MCRLRHPALDVSLSTCVRLWISAYAGSSDRHASSALLAESLGLLAVRGEDVFPDGLARGAAALLQRDD
jgi:hypothetical protein